MIVTLVIFILLNIAFAFIDSRRIRNKKTIAHWMNALVYCVLVGIAFWINKDWWLIPALLVERLLIFQIALSLFRKLKWDYMTPAPQAISDKIQDMIFGKNNGKVMYVIYGITFVGLLIIIFL